LLALAQNVANKNMWQGDAEKPTPTLLAVAFDVAKAEAGAQAGAESGTASCSCLLKPVYTASF